MLVYGMSLTKADTGIEDSLASGERPVAPDLRLPRLSGDGEIALSDFRGRVVVLNVWASWCDPCREESPLLQRWHERISGRGGTVLGVDSLDVTSDARAFVREYGLTYPMVRDEDGGSLRGFGVVGYPETFVIDGAGRITAKRRGPVDEAFMRNEVEPLLEDRG